jgi:hypothetical protein
LPTLCQYRCADLPAQHTDNGFSSKHWIRDSCDLFKKCTTSNFSPTLLPKVSPFWRFVNWPKSSQTHPMVKIAAHSRAPEGTLCTAI